MAADATGTRAVTNTLTGTTVDTVTLQGHWVAVEVVNHDPAEGDTLWVAVGKDGDTIADPAADANECVPVFPGTSCVILVNQGASCKPKVLILGDGTKYTVVGLSSPAPTRTLNIPAAVV